jgi:hypothetical protein
MHSQTTKKPDHDPGRERDLVSLADKFLTLAEVEKVLGLAPGGKTLWRWAQLAIDPPNIRIGRRVFYSRKGLIWWLENGGTEGARVRFEGGSIDD